MRGITWVLAAGCMAAFALSSAHAAVEMAKTDTGTVKGVSADGITAFKGIPYAQPPVGNLRWRPPQPAAKWKGVRNAKDYGPDCMQEPFPGDAAPLGVTPAEDCLYVNVWVPGAAKTGAKLPVMFWIYGGGFVNGGASPAVYDGSKFARDGVVLVSFNYRLGKLGFFAHPALSKEQPDFPAVNYTMMDQVAALKWVRRNIAAFGGDPKNVTIFGESAGGGSVVMLLTSPVANGLFQKAIIESAGGRPGAPPRPISGAPNSAESVGLEMAKKYGIEGEGADALARLRQIPAEQLKLGMQIRDQTYVGPTVDGKLNLGAATDLFAAGKAAHIPVMVGANSADIGFAQGKTMEELFAPFGADARKAKAAYNPEGLTDVRAVSVRIGASQVMIEPVRKMARELAAHGQPVFEYRFSYVADSIRNTTPGALHATEIPYVFDTVAARYGKDLTAADEALAQKVHRYWVAFAKTGKPEPTGLPPWPVYEPKTDAIMDFTQSGPVGGPDPLKARLDLIEVISDTHQQQGAGP
ncbi:MAG TPA: carboxylesterase family protein [Steroidobacteraceae bacterium]